MDGISVAESSKAKKTPKVLHHLEIHPKMGGGHIVTHHYTSYQHQPKEHHFEADDGDSAMHHIAKHAGLPHPMIDEQEESHSEPFVKDKEQL